MATYSFPDSRGLTGAADPSKLARLEYICCTHKATCPSAVTLRAHILGKAHKTALVEAGLGEDPSVLEQIEYFMELEAPHRAMKKAISGNRSKDFVDKVKAFKEGKTKDELKVHDRMRREMKERQVQQGAAPKNKRPRGGVREKERLARISVGLKGTTGPKKGLSKMMGGNSAAFKKENQVRGGRKVREKEGKKQRNQLPAFNVANAVAPTKRKRGGRIAREAEEKKRQRQGVIHDEPPWKKRRGFEA